MKQALALMILMTSTLSQTEGAQICKLQGHLQFKNLYSEKFVLESGRGQCETVQITLTQFSQVYLAVVEDFLSEDEESVHL